MSKNKKPLFSPGIPSGKVEDKKSSRALYSPAVQAQVEEEASEYETIKDWGHGAVQGATLNFADEIYGAGKSVYDRGDLEDYELNRDVARKEWSEARERSPIATTTGEIVGSVVSPGSKALAAGKGLRGVTRGLIEGGIQSYGATDKETGKDQAVDAAKGAALGGVVGGATNYLTKRFSKSPNAVRAEVMGVKGRDYRVDGPGDRRNSIENITKSGMLKNRKMEYDVDKMSFVPRGKSKFSLDELEKNTEERLLGRAEDAVEKIQDRKEQYYGMLLDNRYVSNKTIDDMVLEISDEYSKRGLFKGPEARNEAVLKIQQNIYDQIQNIGGDPSRISLRQLDRIKRMAQEDVKNFSKGLGEIGDNDELARITSRKLKDLVNNNIGDDGFKKLNSAQHDFLTAKGDLQNKIKSLELATPASENVNKTSILERFVDGLSGGSQGRLDGAARTEWYEKAIPAPVRAVVPYALEETPGVIYRQNFQGKEDMGGTWRNPSSVPNIPEQLIRTPLPRSTQGLIDKKPFVLAKIAQMMPEMLDAVKDVYENNPENLGELAQVISMKMPHVFEKDKYNRFDGRILSEVDKQKAIKDTLLNEKINSIEQAKIITKLNKEGIYEI